MAYSDRVVGYRSVNRRRDKRRAVLCRLVAGSERRALTTKDLSLGGFAALPALPGLKCGAVIPVELETPGGEWLRTQVRVVRNGSDFAAAFVDLSPQAFAGIEKVMAAPLRVH
ncbi:MAG: PilZ domain-containing protein [Alphaproteobacteria bacterium]|nr:PilZ domain-containing protein [Alphaproteobacteria bacterium]